MVCSPCPVFLFLLFLFSFRLSCSILGGLELYLGIGHSPASAYPPSRLRYFVLLCSSMTLCLAQQLLDRQPLDT